MTSHRQIRRFQHFLDQYPRLFVLTGAGISVGSGIPEYRDANGDWKHPAPIRYQAFISRLSTRKRYWARSLTGWPRFSRAEPNDCHHTLARWERAGRIRQLVTQNVDRLHQAAGGVRVIDLHGRLDRVICLDCTAMFTRNSIQLELVDMNPEFVPGNARPAPDGDARFDNRDLHAFRVPDCPHCGGMLKPDVVFFGETIPQQRSEAAIAALQAADALLVIGSSLMVYSGFRFCRLAAASGIPIAAVNPGRTRADDLLTLKIEARFEEAIAALAAISPGSPDALPGSTR